MINNQILSLFLFSLKMEDLSITYKFDVQIPNDPSCIHGSIISIGTRNYGNQELNPLDKLINGNVVGIIKEVFYGLKIKDLCGWSIDKSRVQRNDRMG